MLSWCCLRLLYLLLLTLLLFFFFFNDPATTEIYTLSLHDALPILPVRDPGPRAQRRGRLRRPPRPRLCGLLRHRLDRKSTRLNSSHVAISYAVFCLKKKKKKKIAENTLHIQQHV